MADPIYPEVQRVLAERNAAQRDDDRVRCTDCRNLQRWHCADPKRAGLKVDRYGRCEIGPELAALPQRCPAFKPKGQANV